MFDIHSVSVNGMMTFLKGQNFYCAWQEMLFILLKLGSTSHLGKKSPHDITYSEGSSAVSYGFS